MSRIWFCNFCDRSFPREILLILHTQGRHPTNNVVQDQPVLESSLKVQKETIGLRIVDKMEEQEFDEHGALDLTIKQKIPVPQVPPLKNQEPLNLVKPRPPPPEIKSPIEKQKEKSPAPPPLLLVELTKPIPSVLCPIEMNHGVERKPCRRIKNSSRVLQVTSPVQVPPPSTSISHIKPPPTKIQKMRKTAETLTFHKYEEIPQPPSVVKVTASDPSPISSPVQIPSVPLVTLPDPSPVPSPSSVPTVTVRDPSPVPILSACFPSSKKSGDLVLDEVILTPSKISREEEKVHVDSDQNDTASHEDVTDVNQNVVNQSMARPPDTMDETSMDNHEFGDTSSTSGSQSSIGDKDDLNFEPKAEPKINFLDHVTTRLTNKRKVTYVCNYCGSRIDSLPNIKEHIPLHIDFPHFPCERPNCTKSFSSLYDRERHGARHLRRKRLHPSSTAAPSSDTLIEEKSEGEEVEKRVNEVDNNSSVELDRFCICNQFAFGQMIRCEKKGCPLKWFHFPCVGLATEPKKKVKWYCPQCSAARDSSGKRRRRNRRRVGGKA